ncbi:RNA-guided pseudouridylation complex pseudouridine synthase subunit Cbf5 [Candidatus Woesearchaeota archaeon]|jgi:H/ACA ribonucleoprotein complex subunit 4|nr:RNA-guided pseudouridylation complex pseudouridine synthase subunit Cbf5 [Candidatus Woesearchaeota archaeon]MBT4150361.1 RNA-guided pseudouridylation complex pseudouridine synthase subunit Cbf5 [Candidatus Woesearchaeota archaeon]MBT4434506.1 RNA-guided pseudouridylation complex pseudouridine synthase subunit Cbf5 [Candidatus Woesearchaeota archaeon]MBT7332421.1 RNA-guided pseudouridylation complex pseudouridine synthase subunit Cbf5 [Candidatus Woesearchaeota archaeon]
MKQRQIFVKKEEDSKFGKKPEERSTEDLLKYGIVNVDKPKGPTSHQTSDFVKKILKVNKAGHSGTLDPGVTGVQPIAFGKATRIVQFLLTAPKEYVCVMHLHKIVEEEKLREAIKQFIGKIRQLPPVKSAIKREERTREIYEFEIIEIEGQDVLFRVLCQAGTYIRKLCHDIGELLEVGAHMAELRRTQAGPFREEHNLVTLNDLTDAMHYYTEERNDKYLRYCLQPIENAITHLPKCWIFDNTILSLTNGRDLAVPGISKLENFKKGETIAVLTLKGELVAVGEAKMSAVAVNTNEKGIAIKISKVFMQL